MGQDGHLFWAGFLGVTVVLVYDNWPCDIVHCNVLKFDVLCISRASLLTQNISKCCQRIHREVVLIQTHVFLHLQMYTYLYTLHILNEAYMEEEYKKRSFCMHAEEIILTCHVLILTPFVVSKRLAPSTSTSETWASELSSPKLPILKFHQGKF